MKVLQTATDPDRRGAQIFAHELAPTLGDGSWNVRTVALAPGGRTTELPFEVLGRRRLAPRTLAALRTQIRGADVVIGFGSSCLPACAIAGVGTRTPFVYRSIGDLRYWADTRAKRARVRLLLTRADGVVALWPAAGRALTEDFGVPQGRVHVVPRGVDIDTFSPRMSPSRDEARRRLGIPADAFVISVVGALSPEKGVDLAIMAAERIGDSYLLIAGDGPDRPALEVFAARALPGRHRFLGRVEDTRPVYAAGDVLLLTSWSEGVPGVLIEAGLCGRAAVATDVGGTSSVVVDGSTGFLAGAGDVDAVVTGLRRSRNALETMGVAARELYVERFDLRAIGRRWTTILERV